MGKERTTRTSRYVATLRLHPAWYSPQQAGAILGLHPRTVIGRARRGQMRCWRLNKNTVLLLRKEVDGLAERNGLSAEEIRRRAEAAA